MNLETVADRLLYLRKHLGLSQSEFSPKIHKTPGYISQVESGKIKMSEGAITSVCTAYYVSPDWIRNGEGPMFQEGHDCAPADPDNYSERMREVRRAFKMTQGQFAEAIGFSKSQIVSVEVKRANPSRELLQSVARTFKINFQWLLTGTGEMLAPEQNPDAEFDYVYTYLRENERAKALILEAIHFSEESGKNIIWDDLEKSIRKRIS